MTSQLRAHSALDPTTVLPLGVLPPMPALGAPPGVLPGVLPVPPPGVLPPGVMLVRPVVLVRGVLAAEWIIPPAIGVAPAGVPVAAAAAAGVPVPVADVPVVPTGAVPAEELGGGEKETPPPPPLLLMLVEEAAEEAREGVAAVPLAAAPLLLVELTPPDASFAIPPADGVAAPVASASSVMSTFAAADASPGRDRDPPRDCPFIFLNMTKINRYDRIGSLQMPAEQSTLIDHRQDDTGTAAMARADPNPGDDMYLSQEKSGAMPPPPRTEKKY
eukprot:CAMPEP_0178639388 /NCGR_PEP_ID=MMETSP0698-20121128/15434_1 /TAXON_ID=265572 /ORGANISM="Extubocellulus spinifer, Strain CCMP396" /LENGTH=273 /DNA_ID=CAMNT_0020279713 /DNA_START=540 /DNA_END=1363 /DNA_ORIENTATION=-